MAVQGAVALSFYCAVVRCALPKKTTVTVALSQNNSYKCFDYQIKENCGCFWIVHDTFASLPLGKFRKFFQITTGKNMEQFMVYVSGVKSDEQCGTTEALHQGPDFVLLPDFVSP